MSSFHKVVFQWPHTEPNSGIVTGTFDNWSRSVPLTKTPTGLEATVDIPWGHKIKYKFIVDGQWLVLEDQPTEVDPGGYVNNVYTAPPRPITQHIEGVSTNGKAELAETERADSLSQAAAVTGPGFPQSLSDIASTVRDGTSSALGYMASGLGGVVNSFVGIDPINAGQIAISTSKLDPEFDASASPSTVDQDVTGRPILSPETSPGYMTSPVTPLVPIAIVQVNAENKIITSSSSSNLPEVENPPLSSADVAPASSQKGLGDTSHASALAPELHVPEASPFFEPSAPAAEAEKSLVVVAEVPSNPHVDQEVPETQEGVLTPQGNVPEVTAAPSAKGKLLVVEKDASPKDIVRSPGLAEFGDRFETPAISVSPSPALDSEQAIRNGRATPTSTSSSIPSAPSTPVKRFLNPFPTSSPSSSVSGSPSSSKFGTPNSARKKRTSIFGKLKHIFHHDKDHHDKDKEKGRQ